jgi:hypothetical protein
MLKTLSSRKFSLSLLAGLAALAIGAAPVYAQHVGGSSRGGVGHVGGYGGYRGGYGGYRGGYGGYGWRGGYGGWGWRGGYWGPWGWGGLGLGLYFATLPYYYSTYWWGGVPYYYADNTYYQWDGTAGQYVTVTPPAGVMEQNAGAGQAGQTSPGQSPAGQPSSQELMVYPKNGQTEEQTRKDKYECHKWASSQTGFDPTLAGGTAPNRRSDYLRAQMACLEGRGYSVK